MTEVTSHMIQRYLRDECPEEEAAVVRAWLMQHPDELDRHLTDEQWDQFRHEDHLQEATSISMYGQIEAHIQERPKRFTWRLPAVAAMLVATVAIWYMTRPVSTPPIAQALPEKPVEFLENTSGKPLAHRLPDGSDVLLQPGASLKYQHPFTTDKRNITLSGKARFDVAKNPAPFTVSAGKTNTTALGTVFEITSLPGSGTTVLLISGKVKVQTRDNKDVILRPGEELRYDASLHTVRVTRPEPPARSTPAVAQVPPPKETIPTAAIIHFDNTPLSTLFRQLESREKLNVLYDPALLRDRYFTGSYDSGKESLDDFLQTIAVLNNLQIRRSGDSLLVTP